jgi:glycerol-3-phosphate dehydrogenase subunit B
VKVAVIGGGIAGAAAAFEIARLGGRASVFHSLTGSSGLYSGALDFELWDRAPAPSALDPSLAQFSVELGIWALDAAACRVATLEGNVRPARGRDRALLDLERCAGKRVAVVDLERDDWDAPLLAKSYSASSWARQTRTHFYPARLQMLENGFERRISGYDFAKLYDAPARVQGLFAALRQSEVSPDAWLFGPWLGIERQLAQELSEGLGVPVGETTSTLGGSAGARFDSARDRLLGRVSDLERVRVTSIVRVGRGYRVELGERPAQEFAALLLCTGGVAAGGVALDRSFEHGASGFRLSFAAPVTLEFDSEAWAGGASFSSLDLVERGLGLLQRVGIGAREDGSVRDNPGLFVAGDVIAGQPRTALLAALSGLGAARSALAYIRSCG